MTWIFKETHSFAGVSKWASLYVSVGAVPRIFWAGGQC